MPGEARTIIFTYVPKEAGTYTVEVDALSEEFEAVEKPTPTGGPAIPILGRQQLFVYLILAVIAVVVIAIAIKMRR